MMLHTLSVLRQFPALSEQRPGSDDAGGLRPVSWIEPTILERRFIPVVGAEEAIDVASDLLHVDYAYVFDMAGNWWFPDSPTSSSWSRLPSRVRVIAQGTEFDDGAWEGTGHIDIDFGLDTAFLHEELQRLRRRNSTCVPMSRTWWTSLTRSIATPGTSSRLLWSDSRQTVAGTEAHRALAEGAIATAATPRIKMRTARIQKRALPIRAVSLTACFYLVRPPSTFSLSLAAARLTKRAVKTRNGEQET